MLIRKRFVPVMYMTAEDLRERLGDGTEGVFGGSFGRFLRPVDKKNKHKARIVRFYVRVKKI